MGRIAGQAGAVVAAGGAGVLALFALLDRRVVVPVLTVTGILGRVELSQSGGVAGQTIERVCLAGHAGVTAG